MTIPYNVSSKAMLNYVKSCLYLVDNNDKVLTYSASESQSKP